ncbi:hypothetical protein [Corynebacterium sp.]|uniref:hypothetical protein n=1 Tax=Corynebacterium sp. TaxID=1720 RepID=UPI003B3B59B9
MATSSVTRCGEAARVVAIWRPPPDSARSAVYSLPMTTTPMTNAPTTPVIGITVRPDSNGEVGDDP